MMSTNHAMDNILTRRTIRKYDGSPVDEEILEDLLKAGMAAPNAFDERPWHFVVINDLETMKKLGGAMEGCEMCMETPAAILVCGEPALEKLPGIWVQDCSACVQNIQLAAHAHGLGAVWLAIYLVEPRIQAVRDILGVPANIEPFALIPVGGLAEPGGDNERYDHDRVHRGAW